MILNFLPFIDLFSKRLTCKCFDDSVRSKIVRHSEKIWKRISEYGINYESELLRCVSGDIYISNDESVSDRRYIANDNDEDTLSMMVLLDKEKIPSNISQQTRTDLLRYGICENQHNMLIKRLILDRFMSIYSSIDIKDVDGCTPLMNAVIYMDYDTVRMLIDKYRANIKVRTMEDTLWCRKGETLLHIAVFRSCYDIAEKLLVSGADPNAVTRCVQKLTPLQYAVGSEDVRMIKLLAKYGANVNLENNIGQTPLFDVAQYGKTDVARTLVKCGADVNVTDRLYHTPLHMAINNRLPMVRFLVSHQAHINTSCIVKLTPLHLAVEHEKTSIVKLLLDKGAYVNAIDICFRTPLKLAKPKGIIQKLLKKHGGVMYTLPGNHLCISSE